MYILSKILRVEWTEYTSDIYETKVELQFMQSTECGGGGSQCEPWDRVGWDYTTIFPSDNIPEWLID